MAEELALIHGVDTKKAYLAGLLHDIAKGWCRFGLKKHAEKHGVAADAYEQDNPELLHGRLGAAIACKELGIDDEDVLNAICWHTTGRAGMSLLEKIIYIADLTEPGREFEGIDQIRDLARIDINAAMCTALKSVMDFVKQKGFALHPKSAEAYDDYLQGGKDKT